jgi:hypothetical protein
MTEIGFGSQFRGTESKSDFGHCRGPPSPKSTRLTFVIDVRVGSLVEDLGGSGLSAGTATRQLHLIAYRDVATFADLVREPFF